VALITLTLAVPTRAAEPAAGSTWTEPVTGMVFVWVPGGRFAMGCGPWSERCSAAEQPVHDVTVAGFWLGQTEVTQGQWLKVMPDNPSGFTKGDDYPADQTNWQMVHDLIRRLNAQGHGSFRLPSEAEWEYACRSGGQPQVYCGAGTRPEDLAWLITNTRFSTMPVARKAANTLGLHDMSGNLYEWTEDCWHDTYEGAPSDASPWLTGTCDGRILRGGSWGNYPGNLRSSARRNDQDVKCPYIGVRLVRAP